MTTKLHGGKREGAGRKAGKGKGNTYPRKLITFTPDLHTRLMKTFNGGNFSQYIRDLLEIGLKETKGVKQNTKEHENLIRQLLEEL